MPDKRPTRLLGKEELTRKRVRQSLSDEEKFADPWWPAKDITDALDTLHSDGIHRYHDSTSDETFTECRICGEWEGHTDLCPWPAIDKYMGSDV